MLCENTKIALEKLIKKHTSSFGYDIGLRKEQEPIPWLREFLKLPDINKMEDTEDIFISIYDFKRFLEEDKKIDEDRVREFFSDSFLKNDSVEAKIMREFMLAEKNRSYGETLDVLPGELVHHVMEFVEPTAKAQLSRASFAFYNELKKMRYWRSAIETLIAAGCQESVVKELVATGLVHSFEYERLLQA